jgi:hypothetical protein
VGGRVGLQYPDGVVLLIAILTLVLIALVVLVVGAPLRRARRPGDSRSGARAGAGALSKPGDAPASPPAYTRDALEAAREAKYREIRDAELDYRTGKLSREDFEAIDAELRAEAIEILNLLEGLRPRGA